MRRQIGIAAAVAAAAFSTACVTSTTSADVLELHVSAEQTNEQEARLAATHTTNATQPPAGSTALAGPLSLRDALALLARDKARVGANVSRVNIDLAPGTYRLAAPLTVTLGSGWRGTPIALRGPRDAHAVISGARVLHGWAPVRDPAMLARLPAAARGAVRVTDLAGNGISLPATFAPYGFAIPVQPAELELFYRDRPLTLARWPQQGYATIGSAPDGPQGTRFTVAGANAARWSGEPDLRAMGYWARDWADETLSVATVDPRGGVLTLSRAPNLGIKAGQRVVIENALSELTAPGEYYLDRRAGRVYVWPPAPGGENEIEGSVTDTLLSMDNATGVVVSDVTFDMSRGDAVRLQGGGDLALERVAIRNTGARALVSSATNSRFVGLLVERTGQGGLSITAGDQSHLTPGNVVVADSTFDDYARLAYSYRPAISIAGVGDRIEHSVIHNGPHAAIVFTGNDHRIEGNTIYSVVKESSDSGAIYTGRDWTARGTVIDNNFLHDIGSPSRPNATMGIYLDDQASGITIRGNVFARVNQAVFIGGGRDNHVEHNLFVDCTPAVHVDSRGLSWQKNEVANPNSQLRSRLASRHVETGPYAARYPALAHVMSDAPGAPKGTVLSHNAVIGGLRFDIDSGAKPYVQEEQTYGSADVRFAQPMSNDARDSLPALTLSPESPALSSGFEPSARIAPMRSAR